MFFGRMDPQEYVIVLQKVVPIFDLVVSFYGLFFESNHATLVRAVVDANLLLLHTQNVVFPAYTMQCGVATAPTSPSGVADDTASEMKPW
jgi:hypothetical protein